MKTSYFVLFIVLGCSIGCRKIDEPAPNALYKRWKDEKADVYITFLREGVVLYGKDSTYTNCCPQLRFFRTGVNRLIFKGVAERPIPVQLKYGGCPIRCGTPAYTDWEIVSITSNRMVLDAEYRGRQTYIAAP
ncbi:hypothetical protein J2I47_11930 [Fibrella sp. HMF5335]|uniref:Uncharacterized protein n=1 Tax=Fibrella rubiginis TaxID=2817060 RepID=A0A939K5H9_9BACT|nr:hypothetical protein [Fibrella rubiginis]MBO0937256.1 hypothetical protein [Fibrella rubiginis]